uniref:Uncharacterized protein n=1 Tax=Anguilla anguilla TaxID=7936 RepID=A0A0E9P7V2_ANGAN
MKKNLAKLHEIEGTLGRIPLEFNLCQTKIASIVCCNFASLI